MTYNDKNHGYISAIEKQLALAWDNAVGTYRARQHHWYHHKKEKNLDEGVMNDLLTRKTNAQKCKKLKNG